MPYNGPDLDAVHRDMHTLEARCDEARRAAQAAYDVLHRYRDIDYGTQRVSISVSAGKLEEFFEAVDSMEWPLKEPETKEENDGGTEDTKNQEANQGHNKGHVRSGARGVPG